MKRNDPKTSDRHPRRKGWLLPALLAGGYLGGSAWLAQVWLGGVVWPALAGGWALTGAYAGVVALANRRALRGDWTSVLGWGVGMKMACLLGLLIVLCGLGDRLPGPAAKTFAFSTLLGYFATLVGEIGALNTASRKA